MRKLTERILFLKFVGILKIVKIREFQEFLKFIKFEFSIYDISRPSLKIRVLQSESPSKAVYTGRCIVLRATVVGICILTL